MDNNWVCFYLADFKTTLWEAVFIRTLLERVSPGWLTDWLLWGFIRPLLISLWTTHLQGLPLSLPLPHFISSTLPLLFCLTRLTPGAPLTHSGREPSQSDTMMLNSSPMNTWSSGRLSALGVWWGVSVQGGFTIFLKIAVCYPVTVSLTLLLHLETELPIILPPKQRQPCALRDICCMNIQFKKCQTPGPQTVNYNQLTSKLTCKVVSGQEDRIKMTLMLLESLMSHTYRRWWKWFIWHPLISLMHRFLLPEKWGGRKVWGYSLSLCKEGSWHRAPSHLAFWFSMERCCPWWAMVSPSNQTYQ